MSSLLAQCDASANLGMVRSGLVSVIITTYNQANFLPEAIESVLAQTYNHFEIVIVDDESSDHPERVASQYPQARLIQQTNQGVAAARNSGWKHAKGEFIIFLDADDRLLPGALQAGINSFVAHPDSAFVFGRGRFISSNGDPIPTPERPWFEGDCFEQLLQANVIPFPAIVMFRRSALEAVNGFRSFVGRKSIANVTDYDLYLRVAIRHQFYRHTELVAEWRQHEKNTSNNAQMMLTGCVTILKSQSKHVRGSSRRRAQQAGLKLVREHYGEKLIEELRTGVRNRQITKRRLLSGAITLLKHRPAALFGNIVRKIRSMARS
jgi:glycosyltransferase involved in cell wall biosynthesis